MNDLKGKVASVTGAGAGIGKSIAMALAEAGVNVVLTARTQSEVDAAAQKAEKFNVKALSIPGDVSVEADVEALVAETLDSFKRIDILFNNAALPGPTGFITDIKTEDWDRTMAVNLKGMFLCARAVIPAMIKARAGNIINVSSGAGKRVKDGAFISQTRSMVYSISKFGVEGFTLALAGQVSEYNINVNALRPGATATRIHADKSEERRAKMRRADDVKKLALYLAAQGPMGITGESIDAATWDKIYKTRGI